MIINTAFPSKLIIYDNGTQYIPLSVSSSSYITFGTEYINVSITNQKKGAFCTDSAVPITGYKKLCIERSRVSTQTNGRSYLGLSSTMSVATAQPDVVSEEVDRTAKAKTVYEVDLSTVSTSTAYVKWYGTAAGNSDALDNKIYRIWLE